MGLASGASLVSSCNLERKTEKIIPYLVPPDDGVIPGQAVYTPTTCTECPAGCGISAKTVDYRVGKLEGAAGNPINDGALCLRGQSSLSRLYHPDRVKRPMKRDAQGNFEEIDWDDAYATITDAMRGSGSARNAFLSRRTSGSLSGLIDEFCEITGTERLPEFEMFSHAAIREANAVVFDRREIPSYRIEQADFVLTIGADILETFASPVSQSRQFGIARRRASFNWHHVEPHMSLTGMQAKDRFVIVPGSEPHLLAFLLRRVSRDNLAGDRRISDLVEALPAMSARGYAEKTGLSAEQLDEIANQLTAAKKPLVIAGGVSTMNTHGFETAVLAALLQWATGMIGSTVDFDTAENFEHVGTPKDLVALSRRLEQDRIGVLFLADVDPLGTAAGLLGDENNFANASLLVGFGEFMTESMTACHLVLPLSNTLESWGDVMSKRGLLTIVQPVIEPLHDTRTTGDILIHLAQLWQGEMPTGGYQEYIFDQWAARLGTRGVERFLKQGYVQVGSERGTVRLNRAAVAGALRAMAREDSSVKPVLIVAPSIRFFDGRSSDLALNHEVPDPLTTISWGGWVSVSEETAAELGVQDRDEVTVASSAWSNALPAKIQPGLAKGVMTIQFGSVAHPPLGLNSQTGEVITTLAGVSIRRTGKKIALPILSGSQSQEGRGVIPQPAHGGEHHHKGDETLYPEVKYPDYRWGMVIDLDNCIGCSACVAACYIENNVPVVGEDLHLQGREMSWLRIEPFYTEDEGEIQPMLCQHCSDAPCETVCPVFATYHNVDGLNAQVYNRCVGTRYCANNCPYKVRRFNWFDFRRPTELNTTNNPEVSVRGRGVMEKCSFCVQRIRSARDHAKDENRKIADGEVTPACAQTCPTKAIVFGDLQDENTEVRQAATSARAYRVFEPLGTGPAVYYLRDTWKNGKHG